MNNKSELTRIMYDFAGHTMHRSMGNFFHFGRNNNLSISQLIILNRLDKKGSASVSEISQMLDISNSAVSQLLDKLVQMNFITRKENPEDRRIKYHTITEQGRIIAEKSRSARVAWIDSLEPLFDPDETEMLTRAMTLIVKKLEQLEPEQEK